MVKSHFCGLTMLLFFVCQDLKKVAEKIFRLTQFVDQLRKSRSFLLRLG